MKKIMLALLPVFLIIAACSSQQSKVKLEKGTDAYELAAALSDTLPYLSPDKNNILVSTDDFVVSTGEVLKTMQDNYGTRVSQLKNLPASQLRQVITSNASQIGEKKLLLQAAAEANVTVTDSEVDSLMQLQYTQVGGEQQFKQRIESAGISMEPVRKQFREGLIINNYLEEKLQGQVEVTEEDIQEAYSEDKTATVRHILFSTQGESPAETEAIEDSAQRVLEQAKEGADFGVLAARYSDDPGSSDKGGLYEDIEKGMMVKPFEDAAFNIPVGTVGDTLVETRYGYHIIKVLSRAQEEKPLDEVRPDLEQQLSQQKKQDVYDNYVNQLKEEANYEVKEF
ncbi:MAG: peptidylprolyl isomerase [Candidatus Marinimicrobia bacterium]|nr:peptidylprolyl isomerase [Candidatus Neomarinimicrobiota bacterium]MCF7828195.1 peptidylprolyl isomerase [Candidatus Neomarinimicrobiota bacterium]MCF7879630.1 peptidylprolyl isomerase [Candidatus Neomarinimicrobiota bacterium]